MAETETVHDAFDRSVEEGAVRLERSLPSLIATGLVGGLDVSVGVLAMFIVHHATGNELLGALAFGIGFLALTLARSELFTENFLIPINTVVAGRAPWWSVLRLWAGTAVFNLVGAWIGMGLVMMAFPLLRETAVTTGAHPISLGATREGFASAVIGGAVITLMTWMEHSTESVTAKVVSAWAIAFVLAAAPLHHAIVISVEIFAGLHAGAPYGYGDWLGTFGWAALGNVVGGVGLVTTLRLVQVGSDKIRDERHANDGEDAVQDGAATTSGA
jgi:formate/nitrite transporter FocA (FNT family)